MNRLTGVALIIGLALLGPWPADLAQLPSPQPFVTELDLHPADKVASTAMMPQVVRQGAVPIPDSRQIPLPAVITPSQPRDAGPESAKGRAGTGFFIGDDGTLLTAAHVVKDCARMQIISKYVPRTWAALVSADRENDVALLKAADLKPPAILRIATEPPISENLLVLGFPASGGLTVPAEAWGIVENQKFPANIGALANPRELLWMSAPAVTHGFSGGPIFDPGLGAVVGIIKGEVDGFYLRLVRDMPTTGMAIGPGIAHIGELARHRVPYAAISLTSSPGEAGENTLRRATVHVFCWR